MRESRTKMLFLILLILALGVAAACDGTITVQTDDGENGSGVEDTTSAQDEAQDDTTAGQDGASDDKDGSGDAQVGSEEDKDAEAPPQPQTTQLDFSLDPNYGEIELQAGFLPDPFTINITSGGSVDASDTDSSCRGYATSQPDLRLFWSGNSGQLSFYFEGDGDTTLVINGPGADWHCDDDSHGDLQPEITFNNPAEGTYDIWVGSYNSGDFVSGVFSISELGTGNTGQPGGGQAGLELDASLDPNFGEVDLSSGFLPDPHTVSMTSGGSVDVSYIGPGCRGFATSQPDLRLFWSGNANELSFYFEGDGDTTLVINDPFGDWYCDDDSYGGLQPAITFLSPATGVYDIWVGSFSSEDFISGTLNITEFELNP